MAEPRYRQIERIVRNRITAGTYPPGSQIPTEKELAAEFEVSLITTKRALTELADQGLISRKRGSGSFVKPPTKKVVEPPAAPLRTYYLDPALPFLWQTLHTAPLPPHRFLALSDTLPEKKTNPVILVTPELPSEKIYSLTNKDIPFVLTTTTQHSLPVPQITFANAEIAGLLHEVTQLRTGDSPLPVYYDDAGDTPLADQASAQARYLGMSQLFGTVHSLPITNDSPAGVYVFNQRSRLLAFLRKQKHAAAQRVYYFLITYLPTTAAVQLQQDMLPWGVQLINFDWTAMLLATKAWSGTMAPWQQTIPPRFVTGG
ncbi:MAG TPA: hypothetical protein DCY46_06730 [Lactobacillus sp.]|nr:hypothetical protein [Lactobacillus sp.]